MRSRRNSQLLAATHSFTCRVCQKSIQNEVSHKRHERYCRKRLASPAPPRQRSCLACIRAKSRCDWKLPGCGPCMRKGKVCVYSSEGVISRRETSVLSESRSGSGESIPNSSTGPITRQSSSSLLSAGCSTIVEKSVLTGASTPPSTAATDETAPGRRENGLATSPPPACSAQLLRPKKWSSPSSSVTAKLISQILCSFPEKRLDETSHPPYIHISTFHRSTRGNTIHDPLTTCRAIIQDFAFSELRNEPLFWDSIAEEQEKIYNGRDTFDKWTHLASSQSLTLYLLMLVSSGSPVLSQYPNIPITLFYTNAAIFEHLHAILPGFNATSSPDKKRNGRPRWEDWIFAESKLRTAATYFILALCFDVRFGIPCDGPDVFRFEDVDLPAGKLMWEARTEVAWESEMDLWEAGQAGKFDKENADRQERLKFGDLVRYCREVRDSRGRDNDLAMRMEQWQRGADEFGILVTLCGTIA